MEKNLKISHELHQEIKILCATLGVKIHEWVDGVLQEKITEMKNEQLKMDKRKM